MGYCVTAFQTGLGEGHLQAPSRALESGFRRQLDPAHSTLQLTPCWWPEHASQELAVELCSFFAAESPWSQCHFFPIMPTRRS